MPNITLRAARPGDEGYFFALRAELIGPMWQIEYPNDDAIPVATQGRPGEFRPDQTRIALIGELPAGVLHVVPKARALTIQWLLIESQHQGTGIGTHLVHLVQDEARAQGLNVQLEVLNCNERAQRLYERLGFQPGVLLPHLVRMGWDHADTPRAFPPIDLRGSTTDSPAS